MKKKVILVSLLIVVAFTFSALAQQKTPGLEKPAMPVAPAVPAVTDKTEMGKREVQKFSGRITKVDQLGKIIEVKGRFRTKETTGTFMIDDMTKITEGKEMRKMADLKEGMTAYVEYRMDGNKTIAVVIMVAPKAAPKKM